MTSSMEDLLGIKAGSTLAFQNDEDSESDVESFDINDFFATSKSASKKSSTEIESPSNKDNSENGASIPFATPDKSSQTVEASKSPAVRNDSLSNTNYSSQTPAPAPTPTTSASGLNSLENSSTTAQSSAPYSSRLASLSSRPSLNPQKSASGPNMSNMTVYSISKPPPNVKPVQPTAAMMRHLPTSSANNSSSFNNISKRKPDSESGHGAPAKKIKSQVIDLTGDSDDEEISFGKAPIPSAKRASSVSASIGADDESDDDVIFTGSKVVNNNIENSGLNVTHNNSTAPVGIYIPPQVVPEQISHSNALNNVLRGTRATLDNLMKAKSALNEKLKEAQKSKKSVERKIVDILDARTRTSNSTVRASFDSQISIYNATLKNVETAVMALNSEIRTNNLSANQLKEKISFISSNPQLIIKKMEENRKKIEAQNKKVAAAQKKVAQQAKAKNFKSGSKNALQAAVDHIDGISGYAQESMPLSLMTSQDETEHIARLIENIEPEVDTTESLNLPDTPEEFNITLLSHQKLGLEWLLKMEASSSRGGILADDMGLGKTVQAISIILANKPKNSARKTTLIIGPVALLRQWAKEIETKLHGDYSLNVFLYHSQEKVKSFSSLSKYDVVLTSYGTLSSEYKKHYKEVPPDTFVNGLPDYDDGGKRYISPFYSRDSYFHRVILDEAHMIKNKKTLASRACHLVRADFRLCLSGTPMQNNIEELYPLIRFLRIKPYNDEAKFRSLIVLPIKNKSRSYDDFDQNEAFGRLQALLKAVLLRRTKSYKIDGKPILNLTEKNIEKTVIKMTGEEHEFYEALNSKTLKQAKKLLSTEKIGNYSSVLTLLLRLRQGCNHSFLVRIGDRLAQLRAKSENRAVLGISDEDAPPDSSRELKLITKMVERASRLSDDIITSVQQAVTSGEGTCQMCLQGLMEESTFILYTCGHALCSDCIQSFFESNVSEEDSSKANCNECGKLSSRDDIINYQMFQMICIGKVKQNDVLEHFGVANTEKPDDVGDGNESDDSDLDFLTNANTRKEDIESQADPSMAVMHGFYPGLDKFKLSQRQKVVKELISAQNNQFYSSPKMDKCLEIIQDVLNNSGDDKIIVFSQFTLYFDLFGKILRDNEIPFLRYDGSMSMQERDDCVQRFFIDSNKRVLLISLKAGNVGLTLTCANHVVILDPFWNPYVEDQAMDRVHRIGQLKPVTVYKFATVDTVEDRILLLQEKKREMVDTALSESAFKKISRLGAKELRFLFGIENRPN